MSYPFVLVVSQQDVGPIYFVTLEESVLGTKCLGAFYGDAHLNFGSDEALNDQKVFIRRALSLVEQEFGESFVEMLPQNEAPARKKSWLGRLFGG